MAPTITNTARSAMHPPEVEGGHIDHDQPPRKKHPSQERQLKLLQLEKSHQHRHTPPQHPDGCRNIGEENNSAGIDGDGQKANGTHYFDDPTPLHQNINQGFFKECHTSDVRSSQSNSHLNPPKNELQLKHPHRLQILEEPVGPNDNRPSAAAQSLENEKQPAAAASPVSQNETSKQRQRINQVVIEGDASTAFSNYQPMVPFTSLAGNIIMPIMILNNNKKEQSKRELRDKRDRRNRKGKSREKRLDNESVQNEKASLGDDGFIGDVNGNVDDDASALISDGFISQAKTQAAAVTGTTDQIIHSGAEIQDPIHSMLHTEDPILQSYLPQLIFLNDNYYSKIKSYRIGKRNLPLNQIEVILRRRAVRKRVDAKKQVTNFADRGNGRAVPTPPSSLSRSKLPPVHHKNSPPRRKLFPTQQHSPTLSYLKPSHYEDDSTISSTTVASQPAIQIQHSLEAQYHLQKPNTNNLTAADIATCEIPKEEIVGDTSLGLKLNIIQGKVVIQNITALDDGRSSPAQLCGLFSPGDIIIAVNGKSLINGTIHNPVGMDRTIFVLKPLSQPMDGETKEYSREVRLRLMLGEGKLLLRQQEEREKHKLADQEHRKRMGLEGRGGMAMDPAADLFGISSFMAVDQHSGMPMFGNLEHCHHAEEEKEEKKEPSDEDGSPVKVIATKVLAEEGENMNLTLRGNRGEKITPSLVPACLTVQVQIARQIQLDRQWIRKRNTSAFFTMNSNAPSLLRPSSPPPDQSHDLQMTPIEDRNQRLERGKLTMANAKSLVSCVESRDRGIEDFEDEDPMEIASRACGTASVRTGASRRRWHRGGDGVIAEGEEEDAPSLAEVSGASSTNPNFDASTIRSCDSGIEACDHQMLIELAANNESWKMNVMKRLEGYVEETEKENKSGLYRGSSSEASGKEEPAQMSFDSFLFGGNMASMLGKKKQSLALPPGEMTSMLFDLVDLLEGGLPNQIFMSKNETTLLSTLPPFSPDKSVSFSRNNHARNNIDDDATKATDFLLKEALGTWLKSFRPLPWKQRRALWPSHQSGGLDGDSMVSSRMDDNESISLMSGMTSQTRSIEKKKGNLRELIEDLELDHETRRETCRLVTYYFTHKFSCSSDGTVQTHRLSQPAEDEAAALIDLYGSYLDLYKCLQVAVKLHSKVLVDKLVNVAKYDSQHKESMKALQKAKTLLFYEPSMLAALLELLPSISMKQHSSNFDFITLLVSAYPDLHPWCVHEASKSKRFYLNYISSLLNHEGNDAAKRDEALVKEWCSILVSLDEAEPTIADTHRQSFFSIASRDDENSFLYHRDLPFLMDISVKISEFGLALSLANEIMLSPRYCRDKKVMLDVLQHLGIITDKAIEGNKGEINTVILGQVIAFFNIMSPLMEEINCGFNIVAELQTLLEKSYNEHHNNPRYPSSNIEACIATISENASPAYALKVLSQWKHTSVVSPSLFSALHIALIRGARAGVGSELSGSLLRIQRAREEGHRPIVENGMVSWNVHYEELVVDEEEESGGFIWPSVLNGTLGIAK